MQERARELRERILSTAAHLFADRGIANTSTNRIAAEAGVSIGSLYRYFADKKAIIDVLRQRMVDELENRFTTAVLAGINLEPEAAIASSLRGLVDAITAQQGLLRALAAEATLDGLGFADIERRLLLLTRAYLLHLLGPGSEEGIDARAYLMVTVGFATSVRIGLTPPPDIDQDLLIAETAHMIAAWLAAT